LGARRRAASPKHPGRRDHGRGASPHPRAGARRMNERAASRLAWSIAAASFAAAVAYVAIELIRGQAPPSTARDAWFNAQEALGAVAFPLVGAMVASRRKDNALGWLFLVIGASFAISAVGSAVSDTSAFRSSAWQWGTWINTWAWVPGWFGMVTLLPLLFPDGHLPSRRWAWVAWAAVASITLAGLNGMVDLTAGSTAGYRSTLPTLGF